MQHLYRWIAFFSFLLLPPTSTVAQNWLGASISNYGGTHMLYSQPALAAESRHKLYINVAGIDGFAYNDYLRMEAPISMLRIITGAVPAVHQDRFGRSNFRYEYLLPSAGPPLRQAYVGGEIRGPSVLASLNDGRLGLAFTTRLRVGTALRESSLGPAELLRTRFYPTGDIPGPVRENQQTYTTGGAALELAATAGYVVHDNGPHALKAGLTVKRLVGIYQLYAHLDNATMQVVDDPLSTSTGAYYFRTIQGDYGYTRQASYESAWLPGGMPAAGTGWGADVGLVYEYRPQHRQYQYRERNQTYSDLSVGRYQYRVSLAITDLGGILYKNPQLVRQHSINTSDVSLNRGVYVGTNSLDQFMERTGELLSVSSERSDYQFRASLPTALRLGVDYRVLNRLYLNAQWVQPLTTSRAIGMPLPALVALIPRYESKYFDVATPLAWHGYMNMSFGLALRVGPVTLGTDHMMGLVSLANFRGTNVYAALSIPFYHPTPRDPLACPKF